VFYFHGHLIIYASLSKRIIGHLIAVIKRQLFEFLQLCRQSYNL